MVEKSKKKMPCQVCGSFHNKMRACPYPKLQPDQHEPGAKLDQGKPMAGLLLDFGLALLEMSKVATYGANKYSRGGWQHVDDGINRYTDAMMRHILEVSQLGDVNEEDGGVDRDAQIAWNALARLELKLRSKK